MRNSWSCTPCTSRQPSAITTQVISRQRHCWRHTVLNWEARSQSKHVRVIIELEGSLPYQQQRTAVITPIHILIPNVFQVHFNIILPFKVRTAKLSDLFRGFPLNVRSHFSHSCYNPIILIPGEGYQCWGICIHIHVTSSLWYPTSSQHPVLPFISTSPPPSDTLPPLSTLFYRSYPRHLLPLIPCLLSAPCFTVHIHVTSSLW